MTTNNVDKKVVKKLISIAEILSKKFSDPKSALAVFTNALEHKKSYNLKFNKKEEEELKSLESKYTNEFTLLESSIRSPKNSDTSLPRQCEDDCVPNDIQQVNEKDLIDLNEYIGGKNERMVFTRKFLRPSRYKKLYVSSGNSILLYGPPGTGKTMFVKSLPAFMRKYKSFENKVNVFAPLPAQLKGKYVGETEKRMQRWFEEAQSVAESTNGYSILFIDEIESLARDRSTTDSETSQMMTNALLQMMDGVKGYDRIIFIGATNIPWGLDSAILDRFSSKIFIDLPTEQSMKQSIEKVLRKRVVVDDSNKLNMKLFKNFVDLLTEFCFVNFDHYKDDNNKMLEVKNWLLKKNKLELLETKETSTIRLIPLSLRSIAKVVNIVMDILIDTSVIQNALQENKNCTLFCEETIDGCDMCDNAENFTINMNIIYRLTRKDLKSIVSETINNYKSSTSFEEYYKFIRYEKEA